MKATLPLLTLAGAMALPAAASAREVTFTAKMQDYWGNPAYVVLYVTDASGAYQGTLWMAGGRSRYYRHLRDWYRSTGGAPAAVDGVTGASVGPGRTLTVTFDIADSFIDAGYQVHVDAAVENVGESPSEVVAPLSAADAGKPVKGRGFVDTFSYAM